MNPVPDSPTPRIESNEFGSVFPFYLMLDGSLRIVGTGPAWARFKPMVGAEFRERFEVKRPKIIDLDLDSLCAKSAEVFQLGVRGLDLDFRGHLLPRDGGALVLLSPLVRSMEQFKLSGLSLKDLATHDTTADLMVLIQAQATSLDDARRLTVKLKQRRKQLQAAKVLAEAAQAAAERAANAEHQFLAMMSHELRTPMNGVLGMAQLLQDTPVNEEQAGFLESLIHSGDSLLEIISDVLDYSKIESGCLALEEREFDVHQMLETVVSMLAPSASAKGLEFAAWAESAVPPSLIGDETRLKQVLINLANNAIKFTHRGSVSIRIDHDGTQLLCSVEDTGIGIDESAMGGLFDAFTQADSTTTREYGGTGLGLTISKRICQAMGGSLTCESTKGIGSKFSLKVMLSCGTQVASQQVLWDGPVAVVMEAGLTRLALEKTLAGIGAEVRSFDRAQDVPALDWHAVLIPMARSLPAAVDPARIFLLADRAESAAASSQSSALGGYFSLPFRSSEWLTRWGPKGAQAGSGTMAQVLAAGVRVLLVEDNAVNQRLALAFMQKMGVECLVADDGVQALRILETESFDVILMDCQMPVMDGYEATSRIRSLYGSGPKVIAMTANAMAGDRTRCLEAGMDDYLAKPVRYDDLAAMLTRWCGAQAA